MLVLSSYADTHFVLRVPDESKSGFTEIRILVRPKTKNSSSVVFDAPSYVDIYRDGPHGTNRNKESR